MNSITSTTTRGTTTRRTATTPARGITAVVAALALLAGCSAVGSGPTAEGEVVLVTHDSFALPDELIAAFEADTGLSLVTRAPGDGGSLVNQLVLTKDAPLGDVVFGVDTTHASRAVDEGVFEAYTSPAAGPDAAALAIGEELTAIDVGDVCVNVDHEWFAAAGIPEPTTLADLTDPQYADLLVVTDPSTSSPGLAFLLATVATFGDDWPRYWEDLRANGVKVAAGWSDAYYVDFSGPSSEGDRPLVVSYASSPPYEVPEGADTAPTGALLDTCFRQVEYAGVLAGAANPDGARLVVDWLLSPEVQAAIPESMYVHPVDSTVPLPESWARFAPLPTDPISLEAAVITEHRDAWLRTWSDVMG